jgi:hypothetical protein
MGIAASPCSLAVGQVFVVGEKSATAGIATDFTPTNLQLESTPINELGRRQLVRMMEAEQGFAHRVLPMGAGLTLWANGPISPNPETYKKMIYEKGQAAAPGDRVIITSVVVKPDRIVLDINGGPYAKHRFLSHVQINGNNVVAPEERATGARITLLFESHVPQISAPEVKALLQPIIDFGVKSGEQAYAETLPEPIKDAIATHEVLVGMNHRMVLAALGAPEQKVREQPSDDARASVYEEWVYGHVPQTVRFVRFVGDHVVRIEVAVMGKPMEIHDQNEMAGYKPPTPIREINLGDTDSALGEEAAAKRSAPTLSQPGDPAVPNRPGKVQFPDDPDKKQKPASVDTSGGATPTPTPAVPQQQLLIPAAL